MIVDILEDFCAEERAYRLASIFAEDFVYSVGTKHSSSPIEYAIDGDDFHEVARDCAIHLKHCGIADYTLTETGIIVTFLP